MMTWFLIGLFFGLGFLVAVAVGAVLVGIGSWVLGKITGL